MSNYILLVDDEDQILSILEMTMKATYGGEIVTTSSGNKAIAILEKKGPPDLIVSDFRMPDGDGFHHCHR